MAETKSTRDVVISTERENRKMDKSRISWKRKAIIELKTEDLMKNQDKMEEDRSIFWKKLVSAQERRSSMEKNIKKHPKTWNRIEKHVKPYARNLNLTEIAKSRRPWKNEITNCWYGRRFHGSREITSTISKTNREFAEETTIWFQNQLRRKIDQGMLCERETEEDFMNRKTK